MRHPRPWSNTRSASPWLPVHQCSPTSPVLPLPVFRSINAHLHRLVLRSLPYLVSAPLQATMHIHWLLAVDMALSKDTFEKQLGQPLVEAAPDTMAERPSHPQGDEPMSFTDDEDMLKTETADVDGDDVDEDGGDEDDEYEGLQSADKVDEDGQEGEEKSDDEPLKSDEVDGEESNAAAQAKAEEELQRTLFLRSLPIEASEDHIAARFKAFGAASP